MMLCLIMYIKTWMKQNLIYVNILFQWTRQWFSQRKSKAITITNSIKTCIAYHKSIITSQDMAHSHAKILMSRASTTTPRDSMRKVIAIKKISSSQLHLDLKSLLSVPASSIFWSLQVTLPRKPSKEYHTSQRFLIAHIEQMV